MNKLLLSLLLLVSVITFGQRVYSPSYDGTPGRNQPVGISGFPLDGRSKFHDTATRKWRDFQSTTEVRSYFPTSTSREGNFPIYLRSGGTLTNGTWVGGTQTEYWFKNGTADSNLVMKVDTTILPVGPTLKVHNGVLDVADSILALTGGTGGGTAVAYVDLAGNNSTAALNNETAPFATVDAAAQALPSTGGVVQIGIGNFAAPAKASIKSNTTFKGAGKPLPNWTIAVPSYGNDTRSVPTRLVGGTVLKGTLDLSQKDGIILYDLGVDVGSDWCTASNGGVAAEGIVFAQAFNLSGGQSAADGIHTLQSQSRPTFGNVVRNVAALCQSSSAAVHCMVMENVMNVDVSGVTTYLGQHGIVFKGIGGVATNLMAYGASGEGIIVKSNDYANTYSIVLSNLFVSDINGVGAGIVLQNEGASPNIYGINISNFNVIHTSYGFKTIGVLDNCSISNGNLSLIHGNGFESINGLANSRITNISVRACTGNGFTLDTHSNANPDHNSVSGISAIQSKIGLVLNARNRMDVIDVTSYLNDSLGVSYGDSIYVSNVFSYDRVTGTPHYRNGLSNVQDSVTITGRLTVGYTFMTGKDIPASYAPFVISQNSGSPNFSMIKNNAPFNSRVWDEKISDNFKEWRILNDNLDSATTWMALTRTKIAASGLNFSVGQTNFTGYGTVDSKVRIGGMEIQPTGINSSLLMDNMYFDGTNFKYRANGFGVVQYMNNGNFILYGAASGTAGNTATLIPALQTDPTGKIKLWQYAPATGSRTLSIKSDGYLDTTASAGDVLQSGNNNLTGKNTFGPYTTADSKVQIGSMELQPFALNNFLMGENLYYGSTGFKYRSTGFGSLLQFTNGNIIFYTAASGTAGSTATVGAGLQVNSTQDVIVNKLIGTGTRPVAADAFGTLVAGSNASTSTAGFMTAADWNRSYNRPTALSNPTGTITWDITTGQQAGINFTSTGGRTLAFSNLRAGDVWKCWVNNTSGSAITLTLPSNSAAQVDGSTITTISIATGKHMISLSDYDGTNSVWNY